MTPLPFRDRAEAGAALADVLSNLRGGDAVVVLALVRGGVVVGRAVADALRLPLFPLVVRKIGHPLHREYAVGALSEGGGIFLDKPVLDDAGLSLAHLEDVIAEESAELRRRKSAYAVAKRPGLTGKTVILVDDGAATGSTMFAAIDDMRKAAAGNIIVTLPVCPPDVLQRLKDLADEAVALATPEPFQAVGKWYVEFGQVEDDEVLRLLKP